MDQPQANKKDHGTQLSRSPNKSPLQALPREIKHKIFDILLRPPTTISLLRNHRQFKYHITKDLGPLSCTCTDMREEVIAWYQLIKGGLNLTKTNVFGQINLETVDFELAINNDAKGSGRQHRANSARRPRRGPPPSCEPQCPCLIQGSYLRNWRFFSFDPVRRLTVFLHGEEGPEFPEDFSSSFIAEVIPNMRNLEHLDIHICWGITEATLQSWITGPDQMLNFSDPWIPTSQQTRVAIDWNHCQITLWFAGWKKTATSQRPQTPIIPQKWRVWHQGSDEIPEMFEITLK